MKTVQINISYFLLLILALLIFSVNSAAQEKCSKIGSSQSFIFQNTTGKEVEIRPVSKNCLESFGKVVQPGEKAGGNSFSGMVFRVYETISQKFVNEFVLDPAQTFYKIRRCGREGGPIKPISIRNFFPNAVDIREVDAKCEERNVKNLIYKEIFETSANVGKLYKIYDKNTGGFLSEISVTDSEDYFKLENCSFNGTPRSIYIRNGTSENIDIRRVDSECVEQFQNTVAPGRQFIQNSFAGNVYRIYDKNSRKLLREFIVEPAVSTYVVGDYETSDQAENFLGAANAVRRGENLPELQLDETLNKTCQWFADFMADANKNSPAHTVKELAGKNLYPERNTTAQRLTFFGWDKNNTAHFEATALDTVPDAAKISSHFALLWSSSNTHDAPFYDRDRVKYNQVGFGYAKARTGKIKYYACAVFARK